MATNPKRPSAARPADPAPAAAAVPAIKRVRESRLTTHRPARLYLDDVKEAYALLSADGRKVEIEADGFLVADPDALPSVGRVIKKFEMSSYQPYVSVGLSPRLVTTYCHDVNDTIASGLTAQLEALLRRRRAVAASIGTGQLLAVQWALWGVWLVLPRFSVPYNLVIAAWAVVTALFFVFLWRNSRARGLVYTTPSASRIGWLEQNRDALIVGVVSGLIVTIIGGIIIAFMVGQLRLPE